MVGTTPSSSNGRLFCCVYIPLLCSVGRHFPGFTQRMFLSYTIIPTIVVYSVFLHDFGDREHVFQPARRWVARQKTAFFSITSEEQRLLNAGDKSGDSSERG